MPEELDPTLAENLASGTMRFLQLTPGKKILCTKRQLQECLVELAQEAYAMGFLRGQKEQFGSIIFAGAAKRPAWMDLPLDAPDKLARHGLRLRPVVVRSLIGAGYHQLGDLCWASDHELRRLFCVGRKTARYIRTAIRQLQARPLEPAPEGDGGAESCVG
jgi:hypothetical protein